jgi:putative ABC transport system substrate-binding protein
MNLSINIRRLVLTACLASCVAVIGVGSPADGEERRSLLLVTSRDEGPYEGVVAGVKSELDERRRSEDLEVRSLQSERDGAMRALLEARRNGDMPLITVGSLATRAALQAPGDAPVIACMMVDAHELADAKNATGVALEFPLETQLEWVRRFVPKSHAIGVLYNPAENAERIAEAEKIAKRLGLRLITREIHRPQDLPVALDSLAREADVLLAVTDQMVLSRQTAQAILLFSFRNRMPFSGLSASWVKAGALYALERDYEDLGAQCAEMAVQVLKGRRTSSLPPEAPRKVVYVVNAKTAEHLKLRLPPELVDGASKVFR